MPRRSPGSYRVGIARREAILEAAVRHFAKGGYHRTAMARIAADVGITEGGLLHHFPSKKHLLLAVVERRILTAARWLDEVDPGATGAGVLRRLVEITGRQLEEPGLIELFVLVSAEAADTSSPAHRLFAERYDDAVDSLAARLRRAVDSGEFRADTDCTAIARECIAVSDGLQLQWVLSGGTLDLTVAVRAHLERVARAVTTDGSGLGD
ncbi:TetR family transcriptional regulator [Actinoplanes lobatus]|uniref:AcrR family transcriptional regulator n=1 Tax=Actinoplanes lobatus TaxID=113568 RepID=A0A7W7MI11_9ACTN|nr:TetR/AcrR family transcriptional regulator [Actinoplanes lobatus]MBB4751037.1 AcrR family transcriptional regulator [Actinoplanes lobatus]GGN85685.1 TetR family transcriptional regulator [Actinoplanes lobatus]GIE45688.1 TetR family transcriptional regulator [Actinoplanes lobatus]